VPRRPITAAILLDAVPTAITSAIEHPALRRAAHGRGGSVTGGGAAPQATVGSYVLGERDGGPDGSARPQLQVARWAGAWAVRAEACALNPSSRATIRRCVSAGNGRVLMTGYGVGGGV
jgi:hypothetical protein